MLTWAHGEFMRLRSEASSSATHGNDDQSGSNMLAVLAFKIWWQAASGGHVHVLRWAQTQKLELPTGLDEDKEASA